MDLTNLNRCTVRNARYEKYSENAQISYTGVCV
jgi:hypothetical protein